MTRASGKTTAVLHRRVKNQRLASVGYVWAFAALTASPGARAHYDRRKAAGDRHVAAQRNLFNRLLGCLHHCLHTRQTYDEATAFPTTSNADRTPRRLTRSAAWDVFIASKGQGFESPQLHSNQLDLDFGVPAGHRRSGR